VDLPPETFRASSLEKYNKLYIVASRWTIIDIHKFLNLKKIQMELRPLLLTSEGNVFSLCL